MTKLIHKLIDARGEVLADKRQVVVIVSTPTPDRAGDIVIQAGIDHAAFMALGGTVLWQHDPDMPVGKCVEFSVSTAKSVARVQFPPAGVSPKADEILGLIQAGVVNAASIGFSAREWQPLDPKEPWGAQKFDKIELMEFSFVSVPCNAEAAIIQRALGDSGFDPEAERLALLRFAFPAHWKCGASLNLPESESDAFDAETAISAMFAKAGMGGDRPDYSFARKGFLAYEPGARGVKDAYRIPFAEVVDGRLCVTPASLKAAKAELAASVLPEAIAAKARAVIDHYEAKMKPKFDGHAVAELDAKTLSAMMLDPKFAARVKRLLKSEADGHVLGPAEAHHVKCLMKCLSAMGDATTKSLDIHGDAADQIHAMASHIAEASGHAKALQKAKRPKDPDADPEGEPDDDDADPDDSSGSDVELANEAERRKRIVETLRVA